MCHVRGIREIFHIPGDQDASDHIRETHRLIGPGLLNTVEITEDRQVGDQVLNNLKNSVKSSA